MKKSQGEVWLQLHLEGAPEPRSADLLWPKLTTLNRARSYYVSPSDTQNDNNDSTDYIRGFWDQSVSLTFPVYRLSFLLSYYDFINQFLIFVQ